MRSKRFVAALLLVPALMVAGVVTAAPGEHSVKTRHTRKLALTPSTTTVMPTTTLPDISVAYGDAPPPPRPVAAAPRHSAPHAVSHSPRTTAERPQPQPRTKTYTVGSPSPTTAPPPPPAPPATEPPGPTPPPSSSHYNFLHYDSAGFPIHWNACNSIHYVVNMDQSPDGSMGNVTTAFSRLSAASGLHLVYDGETTATGYDGKNHIVISWRTREQTGGLIPEGSVGAANPIQNGAYYTAAVVYFVPDQVTSLPTALHELGHAVGLAHPSDTSQIMGGAQLSNYASGDVQGLKWEGSETCR